MFSERGNRRVLDINMRRRHLRELTYFSNGRRGRRVASAGIRAMMARAGHGRNRGLQRRSPWQTENGRGLGEGGGEGGGERGRGGGGGVGGGGDGVCVRAAAR